MTDGLRKSHLRKAPQVGLSEVGLPEGNRIILNVLRNESDSILRPSRRVPDVLNFYTVLRSSIGIIFF